MDDLQMFSYGLKLFLFITSPALFIVGIYLLYDFDTFMKIEKIFSKGYFQVKIKWLDTLEKNRFWLHNFLLKRRRLLGAICLLDALIVFYANFRNLKNISF